MTEPARTLYFVNDGEGSIPQLFRQEGESIKIVTLPQDIKSRNSILILGGGTDICPKLYNNEVSPYCQSKHISPRDELEFTACLRAIEQGIPILGICRGAQMVCIAAGGILKQHVSGHNHGDHMLSFKDGRTMVGNSYHHQMMVPLNAEHDVIAETHIESQYWPNQDKTDVYPCLFQPEILWFSHIRGLAIQGHPEWESEGSAFQKECIELVRKYCS